MVMVRDDNTMLIIDGDGQNKDDDKNNEDDNSNNNADFLVALSFVLLYLVIPGRDREGWRQIGGGLSVLPILVGAVRQTGHSRVQVRPPHATTALGDFTIKMYIWFRSIRGHTRTALLCEVRPWSQGTRIDNIQGKSIESLAKGNSERRRGSGGGALSIFHAVVMRPSPSAKRRCVFGESHQG